jgi:serine/threonine protein phosphatase PrpC
MASAWVSDIGHQPARQEDRAAVGANFVVVADGVGSMPGGAEAAQVAVGHFGALIVGAASANDVVTVVEETNALIIGLVARGTLPPNCATTLTAAVGIGTDVLIVNVGDSPGWLLDAAGPRSVVRLHRRWDPFRQSFVLLSALGTRGFSGPAVTTLTPSTRTRIVLASDGVVADPADPDPPEVLKLAQEGDVISAARRVTTAVLLGDATDNVTVAVLDIGPLGGSTDGAVGGWAGDPADGA